MPHAIKKVRDTPSSIAALHVLIKTQMYGTIHQNALVTIEYKDTDGDWIALLDDDDLQLAYEQALTENNGNLKLSITPKEKEQIKDGAVKKTEEEHADDGMISDSSESEEEVPQKKAKKDKTLPLYYLLNHDISRVQIIKEI